MDNTFKTYKEEQPVWQGLMNQAYGAWQPNNSNFQEMLSTWSELHSSAVALSTFNTQVHNGGLSQWHGNGYIVGEYVLVKVLDKIQSENSAKVKYIVQQAVTAISNHADTLGTYGCHDEDEYCYDEDEYDNDLRNTLNNLNDEYYAICEDGFLDEVEEYLANVVLERINSMVVGL